MTAQVEGQAHTAKACDVLGASQVALLTATPAVNEEYAGYLRAGSQDGSGDGLVFNVYLDAFTARNLGFVGAVLDPLIRQLLS
ncbi:hypothetical protein PCH70_07150 [Pseudomonas cichorii JBC1]|uniref:Uncharacterized protein n=1 Tax=Pseudomonas cichorii TaxID=36746 RepID=A0ABQ1DUY3_PSECI|nr:hypothetical protein PCH70_07150 [Pseudomonas cichorii JBC1]GFM94837.1 hypothetical protein PSCICP_48090 [Pseudomonas cichorii]SDP20276.1 hypothetical protein SAMN05216599_12217 [Pseudomonas cichorii]